MKNILAKSKILIVDDFSDFRLSIKNMLQQIGALDIDQAGNAREALKKCEQKNYHIILCDYNLGPEQDGQQILEELHERCLILTGTLFLMVTAETSSAKVISAIECQPDGYLTKPFTRDQLEQRLKRLIVKNAALNKIYSAFDLHQYEKAIEYCDLVLTEYPKVRFACLRLKSEILEKQHLFDETLEVFNTVIDEQPLLWAMIGIGRIYYSQQKHKQALQHFLEIKENFPTQVSVLDWIAKCQSALGQNENAELLIKQALDISPKSVRRQTSLGEIAETLNHYDIALKAYGKVINEGSHSCLLKPQHFHKFYENTRKLAIEFKGREQLRLLENAEAISKKMERKYQKQPSVLAASLSSITRLFASTEHHEKTARFLSKLSRVMDKSDCELSAAEAELIESNLQQVPDNQSTTSYLDKLSAHIEIQKKEIAEKPKTDEDSEEHIFATKINREGMILAHQNRHFEALNKFKEAIKLFPDNVSYLLNAAQIILESELLKEDPILIGESKLYLIDSVKIDKKDPRWERYQMLLEKIPNE